MRKFIIAGLSFVYVFLLFFPEEISPYYALTGILILLILTFSPLLKRESDAIIIGILISIFTLLTGYYSSITIFLFIPFFLSLMLKEIGYLYFLPLPYLSTLRNFDLYNVLLFSLTTLIFVVGFIKTNREKNKLEKELNEIESSPVLPTNMDEELVKNVLQKGKIDHRFIIDKFYESLYSTLKMIYSLIKPSGIAIFLYDRKVQNYVLITGKGIPKINKDASLKNSPVEISIKDKKVIIDNAYFDTGKRLGYYQEDIKIQSFISVPIEIEDKVEGVVVADKIQGEFDEKDEELMRQFSSEISSSLSLFRYSEVSTQEAMSFRGLHLLARMLGGEIETDEIVPEIIKTTKFIFEGSFVALISGKSPYYNVYGDIEAQEILIESSICETAIKNQIILLKEDLSKEKRRNIIFKGEPKLNACSLIFCPFINSHLTGGILILNRLPKKYTERDKEIVSFIADLSGTGLEKAWMYSREKEKAIKDGLTGLYNHRFFQESLSNAIETAKRNGALLGLIMFDIDHFKMFNDRYGHQIGDMVLEKVGNIIQNNIRKSDIPARYGGEEFAIILPDTGLENSYTVGDKMRRIVEEKGIKIGDKEINITISGGVATFPKDAVSKDELVKAADDALYRAKSTGRNKIVASSKRIGK